MRAKIQGQTLDVEPLILAKPNLFNAHRLFFHALRGKRIFLLGVNTQHYVLRVFRPGLLTLSRALRFFPNVSDIATIDHRLETGSWYRDTVLLANIFGRVEEWVSAHFRFSWADKALPDYAHCYKAMICSAISDRQFEIFSRLCLEEHFPGSRVKLVGIDDLTVSAMEYLVQRDGTLHPKRRRFRSAAMNLPTAIIVFAVGLFRLLRYVRFGPYVPEKCFLMADYIGDTEDTEVYRVAVDYGPVILVARNARQKLKDDVRGTRMVQRDSGIFTPRQFWEVAKQFFCGSFQNFLRLGWLGPAEFYRAATMPFKLCDARALLNRFIPQFFYARDCYSYEHILRHAELRRVGAVHIGINVGYPVYTTLNATTRYIHFDKYLVYGEGVYRDHYLDKWPDDLEIIPVGPFRTPRQTFVNRTPSNPNVIPIFCGVYSSEPGMVEFVRAVALALPDKKFLLQVKPVYLRHQTGRRYADLCMAGIDNIELTEENIYSLLSRVKYAITDPSSIIVEAMSFGVECFLVDVCPWHDENYIRQIDEVMVRTGEEAARKIRAFETGDNSYPWEKLTRVSDLSGEFFGDKVRQIFVTHPDNNKSNFSGRAGTALNRRDANHPAPPTEAI